MNAEALGNAESTLAWSDSTRVLSMSHIDQNSALILEWIVWNGIVFDTETAYLC